MKRISTLIILLALSLAAFAANNIDILIKANSEKIEAIIQEVSDTEVKYKKASNPTGPTYIIKLSELATIIYSNGDVQAITPDQSQPAAQPQQQPAAQPQQSQQQAQQPAQNSQYTFPEKSSSGYNFDYSGIEKAQKEKKEKKERQKRTYEWENFFLLNYLYGQFNHHALGFTYGRVKLAGWYISASIGVDPNFHYGYDYVGTESDHRITIDGNWTDMTYPFYTGKVSRNQATLSAGFIIRMVIPFYWYVGLGGGYLTRTYAMTRGKWAMLGPQIKYNGANMVIETGLQGNIKGFTLSAGYYLISNFDAHYQHEAKIGIGYTFPDKKKQAKQQAKK